MESLAAVFREVGAPISIERIGLWIKAIEGHGIMLVPLTTAMLKSRSG